MAVESLTCFRLLACTARMVDNWQMDKFVFADVRHKLHACCHGTHAMVEALLKLQVDHQFKIDELCTHPIG